MKRYVTSLLVSAMAMAMLSIGGCKHDPNPPTEQDAIAVAKNINRCLPVGTDAELISLKKTNGQMETVNGIKVYTLYYTASKKNLVKIGIQSPRLG